ncbi:LOG family protein [Candidatus Peregrinibacteria bacterium]|nr:LOG family protein [Candidatus Peregrinibacteria bacterium]MBI3816675.1 LOG family protein [Candidatus Peregrinibacteria bacterium]
MPHNHRLKIGVMGSASGPQTEDPVARTKARELGRQIAKRGYIFINGACPGLPNDALLGAKECNGFTIGVSPAFSEYEHINEYLSPHDHDVILYTGMGFMERDIINIRSADAIVLIGGGIGTLNEFTIAYDEGRPIGVVTNSGGISNSIPHIVKELCKRELPPNLVMDDDPSILLDKLEVVIKAFPLPIREDGRVRDKRKGRG